MKKTGNIGKLFAILLCAVTMLLGLTMTASADTVKSLPDKDQVSESWFYLFNNKAGEGWLAEVPKGTTLSGIKSSKKNYSVKIKSEKWEDGKHYFIVITAKKPGNATVKFTAKYGNKKKSYKVKVVAMKYKNFVKTLKIGNKDYTSKYKKYDYSYHVNKQISGKLTIKANTGFKLRGVEIRDENDKLIKKVKNGQKITIKKGQSLHVYYYYKAYKCNGGLGAIWVD